MLNKTIIKIYFIFGLIFLILAIIGMILPLLPTTPFALVAIYFFDKSSPKFHKWCLNTPGLGNAIKDWNKGRVIGNKAKIQATILLLISGTLIIINQNISNNIKCLACSILLSVLIFILSRKTKPTI
jgi:uncharacterized membrane protein YbaN (DUF454 family)